MRKCAECGKNINDRHFNALRCGPCATERATEQRRQQGAKWYHAHRALAAKRYHRWYVANRQNNPKWVAKNKQQAKIWRAKQKALAQRQGML